MPLHVTSVLLPGCLLVLVLVVLVVPVLVAAQYFPSSLRTHPPRVDPSPTHTPLLPPLQLPLLGYHMASVMGGRYETSMGFGLTKWLVKFSFFTTCPPILPPRLGILYP